MTASAPLDDHGAGQAAKRYDEVPYQSRPNGLLDPARLAAVAILNGHDAPDPTTARVLEIGCATGGHIIPLAARHPLATYLGVDVSGVQIAAGSERIAKLGLSNIRLETKSVTDVSPGDGPFDYIICHGVFSWVSEPIRQAILRQCSALLSPRGIAVISFNVLPGWRMLQVVRDTALLHAKRFASPEEKAHEMRSLFAAMSKMTVETSSYGSIWRNELAIMTANPDYYLLHELLEDDNTPMTFSDFASAAAVHGLNYLGDANFLAGIPENSSAERAGLIRALAQTDVHLTEQYTDIVVGRTFRSALMVKTAGRTSVAFDTYLDRLNGMHLVSALDLSCDNTADGKVLLKASKTRETEIGSVAAAHAVRRLLERRPSTSAISDLFPADASEAEKSEVEFCLKRLVCMGLIDATVVPLHCPASSSTKPRIWPLAAFDAAAGAPVTATLRHATFTISDRSCFLMRLADGTRTLDDIAEALLSVLTSGSATISENGTPITDTNRLRRIAASTVTEEFETFAGVGLLVE
jgi:2-polyprenyl-3-methyl-5-hydroxy-6-metoxy-1,4-benzoquinol methylase